MTHFRRARRPWHPRERSTRNLLSSLSALYQLLQTPRPIDDLLQAILDTALRCVPGAQRGSLFVVAEGYLHYRATVGYDLESLRAIRFPADLVEQTVLRGGRNAHVTDYATWDEQNLDAQSVATLRKHGQIEAIRSSLVTGIQVGERFYGTLVLDNLRSHAPFPATARTLAQLFADQAGTLIEQAERVEQLREANSQIIEAERMAGLGRFIANIAHEINNPLTAVLGYANLLDLQPLDAESRALLEQLQAGAERVRTLVRNLQLFARQQQAGFGLVDLDLMIEQTLMLKRGELHLDQITVTYERATALPHVWADGGALSQVLLNLIANAQYTLRGRALPRTIRISTTLAAENAEPVIEVRVSDNGPGVPEAIRERIFEPFFSTKPADAGTGLGLSICRNIALAHHGRLWLDPTQGGASFVLGIPLRLPPDTAPTGAAAPALRGPARLPVPQGLQILVVDDDPAVVALIRQALGGAHRLSVAGNGAEALALCAIEPFDVILCDLRMPIMSGPEFYTRLQHDDPALAKRVIFISGDTSSPAMHTFLESAERPVLHKPFTPTELHTALTAVLG